MSQLVIASVILGEQSRNVQQLPEGQSITRPFLVQEARGTDVMVDRVVHEGPNHFILSALTEAARLSGQHDVLPLLVVSAHYVEGVGVDDASARVTSSARPRGRRRAWWC